MKITLKIKVITGTALFLLLIAYGFIYLNSTKNSSILPKNKIWVPLISSRNIFCINDKCYQRFKEKTKDYNGKNIDFIKFQVIKKPIFYIPKFITSVYWKPRYENDSIFSDVVFEKNKIYFTTRNTDKNKLYIYNFSTNSYSEYPLGKDNVIISSISPDGAKILFSLTSNFYDNNGNLEVRGNTENYYILDVTINSFTNVGFFDKFTWLANNKFQLEINSLCYLKNPTIIDCELNKTSNYCGLGNYKYLVGYTLQTPNNWVDQRISDDSGFRYTIKSVNTLRNGDRFEMSDFVSCLEDKYIPPYTGLKSEKIIIDDIETDLYLNSYHSVPTPRDQTNIAHAILIKDSRQYFWQLTFFGNENSVISQKDWNQSVEDFKLFLRSIKFFYD